MTGTLVGLGGFAPDQEAALTALLVDHRTAVKLDCIDANTCSFGLDSSPANLSNT